LDCGDPSPLWLSFFLASEKVRAGKRFPQSKKARLPMPDLIAGFLSDVLAQPDSLSLLPFLDCDDPSSLSLFGFLTWSRIVK
jgi:hypothetical protein